MLSAACCFFKSLSAPPPQDQTAGLQLRDASSTKASQHTRRTSSWCRNRYAAQEFNPFTPSPGAHGPAVGSQVVTKTVAQCVEFYYTYKKHVKIGRNGTLLYGEAEPAESRSGEEDTDHKVGSPYGMWRSKFTKAYMFNDFFLVAQRLEPQQEEDSRKWEGSADRKQEADPSSVTHTLQPTHNVSAK